MQAEGEESVPRRESKRSGVDRNKRSTVLHVRGIGSRRGIDKPMTETE